MNNNDPVVIDFSCFGSSTKSSLNPNYHNPIDEYTMDGTHIGSYISCAEAERCTGIKLGIISQCVIGQLLCLSKYNRIFIRKGNSINQRLKQIQKYNKSLHKKHTRTIKEYDMQGNLLFIYPSIVDTAEHLKVGTNTIYKCIKGKTLSYKGKIYLYEEDSIDDRLAAISKRQEYIKSISGNLKLKEL